MTATPTYCHLCHRKTPTMYFPFANGDIGNLCKICRTCRRGRPYITHAEYQFSLKPIGAEGAYDISLRKS